MTDPKVCRQCGELPRPGRGTYAAGMQDGKLVSFCSRQCLTLYKTKVNRPQA